MPFQSTLPAGGATLRSTRIRFQAFLFQSTLPAGGATYCTSAKLHKKPDISIHAPRGGSDSGHHDVNPSKRQFQSTLPAGGATMPVPSRTRARRRFQSTLPAGGATPAGAGDRPPGRISIHAPRGGSDEKGIVFVKKRTDISIHAPRGGSDR